MVDIGAVQSSLVISCYRCRPWSWVVGPSLIPTRTEHRGPLMDCSTGRRFVRGPSSRVGSPPHRRAAGLWPAARAAAGSGACSEDFVCSFPASRARGVAGMVSRLRRFGVCWWRVACGQILLAWGGAPLRDVYCSGGSSTKGKHSVNVVSSSQKRRAKRSFMLRVSARLVMSVLL